MPRGHKGEPKTPGSGRRKGTPNKIPGELRAYVLATAERLEAEGRGLYEWALENPDYFWTKCFMGVIPKNLKVSGGDGPLVKFVITND